MDPWFIVDSAPEEARLIRIARDINDGQSERVVEQVIAAAGPFERPVIACLGLAYKPDIDDLRESPALEITVRLAGLGLGSILAVEPHIAELPADLVAAGVVLVSLSDAMNQADVLVLLVDHQEFKRVPPATFHSKTVVDTRGIWP